MEISLFADDTNLFCIGENYSNLELFANRALSKLNKWLGANRLTLNISKTHYVDFSKHKNGNNMIIKINDEVLIEQNETRYLGILLQNDLNWEIHIKDVINKLNKQIPLYLHLRNYFSPSNLNSVYNALSFSIINYGIELYGRKHNRWLQHLQRTQNRILKILLRKPKLFSTNAIHRNNNMLKVHDKAKLRLALICHRAVYKRNTLNAAHDGLILSHQVHNRNLRNTSFFQIQAAAYNELNKVTEQ